MEFHVDGNCPIDAGVVFVFGSNLAGRHGAGAAKAARNFFSAQYGTGRGRTGSAYAIPTKDEQLRILPLSAIHLDVVKFLEYARSVPSLSFFVTRVGCGLAGYRDEVIAPMFKNAPDNCSFAEEWKSFLM